MEAFGSMLAALGLAFVFDRLGLPGGAVLGAMVGVAASKIIGVQVFEAPGIVRFLAFATVGWLLGQSFGAETVATLRKAAGPVLLVVLTLGAVTAVLAITMVVLFRLDALTGLLAASPGGLVHIGSITADSGARVDIVILVHLARLAAVVITLPIVARFL